MENIRRVQIDIIDSKTGEIVPMTAQSSSYEKHYIIKKLNFKGSIMDLFGAMEEICSSSKDIQIIKTILYDTDKENRAYIVIKRLAAELDVSVTKMSKLISKCRKVGLLKKTDKGYYIVNPFMFKSKGSTNEIIARVQSEWNSLP